MKTRSIAVLMEVDTDMSLRDVKTVVRDTIDEMTPILVLQVQANVIDATKRKKAKRK